MKVHITEDMWFWTLKFVTGLFNNTAVMKSTQIQVNKGTYKENEVYVYDDYF